MSRIFRIICLIIIPLFTLSSCKKDDKLQKTYSGVITSKNFNQPVSGALVLLKAKNSGGGASSSNYIAVGEAATNENGEFKIEYKRVFSEEYVAVIAHAQYFDKKYYYNPNDLYSGKYSADMELLPKSYMKMTIQGNGESLRYSSEKKLDCSCCPKEVFVLPPNQDTSFVCGIIAGEYYQFNWVKGAFDTYSDSVINSQLLDTAYYVIAK